MENVTHSGVEHVDPVRLPLAIGDDVALFDADDNAFLTATIDAMTTTGLVRVTDQFGDEREYGRHRFESKMDEAERIEIHRGDDE